MRLLLESFIASILLHVIYFLGVFIVGFTKSKLYKPDISHTYENVEMLQNKVTFGIIIFPGSLIVTITGLAVVCGIVIFIIRNVILRG